ncbi:MAG: DNRLRE domain-containing protein [Sedimentisphaerales bacterium]|nr:DNRLRE domain-containing protein [Sedimentisphaerales bacterium]
MIENQKIHELSHLMTDLLEGTISKKRFNQLQSKLANDPSTLAYYVEFMALWAHLDQICEASSTFSPSPDEVNDPLTAELLREAIEQDEKIRVERAAEESRLEADAKRESTKKATEEAFEKFKDEERRRQEKLAYKRYKAHQRRLVLSISALAAGFLIVFTAWILTLIPEAPPVVASITKVVNAQWDRAEISALPGTPLIASPMKLVKGYVQLTFNDGAVVNLRAPVDFKLENSNMMFLRSGNLFSSVPKRAKGFTVRTPIATIVDYGTEFGVNAYPSGQTEAHIFKGTVDLRTGSDLLVYNNSRKLTTGQASAVDGQGTLSRKISKAKQNLFVQELSGKLEESSGIPIAVENYSFETTFSQDNKQNVDLDSSQGWSRLSGTDGVRCTFREGLDGYAGTQDTWFSHRSYQGENKGLSQVNYIRTGMWDDPPNSGANQQGLLKFDEMFEDEGGPIPRGAVIYSATLTMHTPTDVAYAEGEANAVYKMLVDWSESDAYGAVPWEGGATRQIDLDDVEAGSTAVDDCTDYTDTSNVIPKGTTMTFDVTSAVQDWANGDSNYGFLFQSLGQAGGHGFFMASSSYNGVDGQTVRPTLNITFASSPLIGVPGPDGANGSPTHGRNLCSLLSQECIYQLLNYNIVAGETYILTADVKLALLHKKQSRGFSLVNFSFFYVDAAGNHIKLLNNSVSLNGRIAWTREHKLVFEVPKSPGQDYLGKKLGIELRNMGPENTRVFVDNVRVEVIPES